MIVADQATLTERFREIGGDWLAERLAPKFAHRAGRELTEPEGVDLAVELAFFDLCEGGMPEPAMIALSMHKDAVKRALAV